MSTFQIVFAFVLVAGVSLLALFYIVRQIQLLRQLRQADDVPPAEAQRERNQIRRRLVSAVLLLIIAGLVTVVHLGGWEEKTGLLAAANDGNASSNFTADERRDLPIWGGLWLAILLLLLAVLVLAAIDFWSIRRYGRLEHRKLRDDRRAMIANQLRRLREERDEEEPRTE